MNNNVIKNDIAIIGMGPAGITAAIYLKRYGMNPVCFEKDQIGGKVNITAAVENYPGYASSSASELVNNFKRQLEELHIDVVNEKIEQIKRDETTNLFSVTTDKSFYEFKAIILCTGLKEREYIVPNQNKYNKTGISRCAVCDGMFYRNLPVAVLGGGNSAFEEALYLADITKHVYLINRRDEFRADPTLVDEFKHRNNTSILTPYVIENSDGDFKLRHLTLKNTKTEELMELDVEGLFIYVGSAPVNEIVKIDNLFNQRGFITTNEVMETEIPGFFVAGDCRDTPLRQIVTACNDGALSATSARKYIKNLEKEQK